jgi:hypothetical protein
MSGGLTGWRRANHLAMGGGRRCDCCGGRHDDSDRRVDIEGRQRRVGFSAQRKAAHLAFDAAPISPVAAGDDAFLEDFLEYGVMQRGPPHRGEWPRIAAACDE